MAAEGIAAILVALSTFIGGVILAFRGLSGDKFNRKVTESAALLTGYTEMVSNLREEIREIRADNEKEQERSQRHHKVEIENLIFLHDEERKRWETERVRLTERIDLLESQVAALLYRPKNRRTRANDEPE